jgi:C-terminal processing protease CtpA/Prc
VSRLVDPRSLVEAALERLCSSYIFPDRAAAAAAELRRRIVAGRYDSLAEEGLCSLLTQDLQETCPDRHLRLQWSPQARPSVSYEDPEVMAEYWRRARLANHGVDRVERLPGNVGYFDLRSINEAEQTAPTLNAAMQLVTHTDALLLDLRRNLGGAPSGVAFLCGYFVPAEPVHVNDVYFGATGLTQQFWTYAHLPGPRYLDRPVWVLTSSVTFSGGEELAYNLQQLGRATLVGETTRGGAHPTDVFALTEHVVIRVPVARSINPISGTNWEGKGVAPDVAVNADEAYPVAYAAALRAVLDALGEAPASHQRTVHAEATQALAALAAGGR